MVIIGRSKRKPAKLTLSPTKISTYLACRVMYKYTYINKISRFYYRPRVAHSFGSSMHKALEEFHKAGGAETQSPEQLVEKMHEVWSSMGYASEQEEAIARETAAEFLEQYHTAYQVEGVHTIATEKVLKVDMGEFNLMGRVDRLDEHPDGHIEIVDYKSGRLSVEEDEVRNSLAMGIYTLLARRLYPDQRVTASIYALRTGAKATVELTDEELAEIDDAVRAVAEEVARIDIDTDIEPVWLPKVCPECDYLHLCARRMHWNLRELMQDPADS